MMGTAVTFVHLVWFQTRQLARTSFFLQTTPAAPSAFILLRLAASLAHDGTVSPILWFDGTIAGIWATTNTATGLLGYQRFLGTFEHLATSTLRPGIVYGSVLSASAMLGLLGLPAALAFQLTLGNGLQITGASVLGLLAALFACSVSALGLAAVFVASRHAIAYEPILLVPTWLLVGIVIPTANFPVPLAIVAYAHPLTSAVSAGQAATLAAALGWTAMTVAITAVWFVVSRNLLRKALKRAATHGSFSHA